MRAASPSAFTFLLNTRPVHPNPPTPQFLLRTAPSFLLTSCECRIQYTQDLGREGRGEATVGVQTDEYWWCRSCNGASPLPPFFIKKTKKNFVVPFSGCHLLSKVTSIQELCCFLCYSFTFPCLNILLDASSVLFLFG